MFFNQFTVTVFNIVYAVFVHSRFQNGFLRDLILAVISLTILFCVQISRIAYGSFSFDMSRFYYAIRCRSRCVVFSKLLTSEKCVKNYIPSISFPFHFSCLSRESLLRIYLFIYLFIYELCHK
jgi:hypothetical protein